MTKRKSKSPVWVQRTISGVLAHALYEANKNEGIGTVKKIDDCLHGSTQHRQARYIIFQDLEENEFWRLDYELNLDYPYTSRFDWEEYSDGITGWYRIGYKDVTVYQVTPKIVAHTEWNGVFK